MKQKLKEIKVFQPHLPHLTWLSPTFYIYRKIVLSEISSCLPFLCFFNLKYIYIYIYIYIKPITFI